MWLDLGGRGLLEAGGGQGSVSRGFGWGRRALPPGALQALSGGVLIASEVRSLSISTRLWVRMTPQGSWGWRLPSWRGNLHNLNCILRASLSLRGRARVPPSSVPITLILPPSPSPTSVSLFATWAGGTQWHRASPGHHSSLDGTGRGCSQNGLRGK